MYNPILVNSFFSDCLWLLMWFYISRLLAIEQFNLQFLLTDIFPSVVQRVKYCVEFPLLNCLHSIRNDWIIEITPTEKLGWLKSWAETGIYVLKPPAPSPTGLFLSNDRVRALVYRCAWEGAFLQYLVWLRVTRGKKSSSLKLATN